MDRMALGCLQRMLLLPSVVHVEESSPPFSALTYGSGITRPMMCRPRGEVAPDYLSLQLTAAPVNCRPMNCRRLTVVLLDVVR